MIWHGMNRSATLDPKNLRGAARREYGLHLLRHGLNGAEVARLLRINTSTVHRWKQNSHREFGKHSRKCPAELQAWQLNRLFGFLDTNSPQSIRDRTMAFHNHPNTDGTCPCTNTIREMFGSFCPWASRPRMGWTSCMVLQLIQLNFPNSAQARWTTKQIEEWLKKYGYELTGSGWTRSEPIDFELFVD